MSETDKVRDAFEAWITCHTHIQEVLERTLAKDNKEPRMYILQTTYAAFEAWKASRAAALNEAIEVCHEVLAPTKQSNAEATAAFRDAYITGVNRCINRLERIRDGK